MKTSYTNSLRRIFACIALSVLLLSGITKGQCLSDQFLNPALWTNGVGGTNYPVVGGGQSTWTAVQGSVCNYIYRPLGFTLNSTDSWTAEITYTPTAGNCPSHSLMSLTSATTNSWNVGPPGYAASVLDAVEVYIISGNCTNPPWQIIAKAKDDVAGWGTGTTPILLGPTGQTYYIRLQRFSATQGMLSIFTNPSFTTHVTGSPQCFPINQNVTGLTHVQQGCMPQGGNFRTLTATFSNLNICNNNLCEPYNSSTGWTQTGTGVAVVNPVAQYTSCAAGADNRITRSLQGLIETSQQWVIESDFKPTAVGFMGAGNGLVCLSAGNSANIWNGSVSMDAVAVYLASSSGIMNLYAAAKDGTSWSANSTAIVLPTLNTTYYIRLSRCGSSGLINIFSDAARTTHITGSPQSFPIPVTVEGLNTLGHSSMQSWSSLRSLTGTIDNTCIYNYRMEPGSIAQDQHICYGAVPAPLTNAGNTGCCTYQWEREAPCGSNQWQSIVGATGTGYSPPALTQTTCYRRRANYNCGSSSLSNTVMITVDKQIEVDAGDDQVVCCRHYPPPPVIYCYLSGSASGGVPGYTYSWSCSPNFLINWNTANPFFEICDYYAAGVYQPTFTLTVTDANGCQAQDQITVSIQTCLPPEKMASPGLDNNDYTMSIVPNPNTGNFTVQFKTDVMRSIEILDALGRIVYVRKEFIGQSIQVDLSEMPKGAYTVQCHENGQTYQEPIIIR